MVRGGGGGGGVGRDVGGVRGGGVAGAPGGEQVVAGVLRRGVGGVVAGVHHLPHLLLLLLVHVVGQLRLLVACGRHPLVTVARHRGRVRGVQTRLQSRLLKLYFFHVSQIVFEAAENICTFAVCRQ